MRSKVIGDKFMQGHVRLMAKEVCAYSELNERQCSFEREVMLEGNKLGCI